jgi:predicted amidohydrolase
MRIAVAQTPGTELAEWRRTLEMLEQAVNDAAQTGAELVVMPGRCFPRLQHWFAPGARLGD